MDEDLTLVVSQVTQIAVISYLTSRECGLSEAESMCISSIVASKLLNAGS